MILEKPLYKKKIVINNKKKSLFPTIKTTNFQTIINFILLICTKFVRILELLWIVYVVFCYMFFLKY